MSINTMTRTRLSDRVGIDDRDWEIRKRAAELGDEDIKILRSLEPWARDNVQEVVDAAYDHLMSFPEGERMLRATGRSLRSKTSSARFPRDLQGQFDSAYGKPSRAGGASREIGISARVHGAARCVSARGDLRLARHSDEEGAHARASWRHRVLNRRAAVLATQALLEAQEMPRMPRSGAEGVEGVWERGCDGAAARGGQELLRRDALNGCNDRRGRRETTRP